MRQSVSLLSGRQGEVNGLVSSPHGSQCVASLATAIESGLMMSKGVPSFLASSVVMLCHVLQEDSLWKLPQSCVVYALQQVDQASSGG